MKSDQGWIQGLVMTGEGGAPGWLGAGLISTRNVVQRKTEGVDLNHSQLGSGILVPDNGLTSAAAPIDFALARSIQCNTDLKRHLAENSFLFTTQ